MRRSIMGLAALVLLLSAAGAGVFQLRKSGGWSVSPEVLARGAELYQAKCQGCHGGAKGGEISDIPPVHNRNGHTWHHTDCQLEELIENGFDRWDGMRPDQPKMPAFKGKLSKEEIRAILAYVKTWWTAEQREGQARITRERC